MAAINLVTLRWHVVCSLLSLDIVFEFASDRKLGPVGTIGSSSLVVDLPECQSVSPSESLFDRVTDSSLLCIERLRCQRTIAPDRPASAV